MASPFRVPRVNINAADLPSTARVAQALGQELTVRRVVAGTPKQLPHPPRSRPAFPQDFLVPSAREAVPARGTAYGDAAGQRWCRGGRCPYRPSGGASGDGASNGDAICLTSFVVRHQRLRQRGVHVRGPVCGGSSTPKGPFQPDHDGRHRSSCPGNDESPWIESEGRWARSNHWLSPHSVRKESAIRS